jgi:hypothetical protein
MTNPESGDASDRNGTPAKIGFWQRLKHGIIRTEREFAFVKGLAVVSLFGTLIGAYFQNLSAYQDKVTTLAKDDMTAATGAFTDASSMLSTAMTLQGQLYYDFTHAVNISAANDTSALTSKEANDLYNQYEVAFTALHENIDLLARKMEIYLDWPSDRRHDPANDTTLGVDPISTSLLGTYSFDCDQDMPTFDPAKIPLRKTMNGTELDIDWRSAKHHVLTLEYCIEVTHKSWMEIVRQWSSQSTLDQNAVAGFFGKTAGQLQDRLNENVVRLNAFMSLAMNQIEQIRVKYRPNGFVCGLPGVSQLVSLFGNRCMPVRTASIGKKARSKTV